MSNKNFILGIIDEVALEGLDGITLQGLFLRLEQRRNFGLKPITEKVKLLIWEILIKAKCLNFYILPSPREDLVAIDRFAYIDANGNYTEPPYIDRIYPHFPINDEANGIMGSAEHYYTRELISEIAKTVSLDEALIRWGNRLVVVADQKTRKSALCGNDISPLAEMNINNYCMLERVGRNRYNGDITHGKNGLQVISSDSKMLFYYRKCLLKYGLVTSQTFHVKIKNQNFIGKLIHLKRFFVQVKSKHASDAEKIIDHLKKQPQGFMLYTDLFKFDLKACVKKILQKHYKALVTELVPYRTAVPDAPQSQWKAKSSDKEKVVRIVRLVGSELADEDENEEEEEEEHPGILDEGKREIGQPLLRQGYLAIEKSNTRGISQAALSSELGLTSLQGRSICKLLKKYKLCETMPKDVGRQRVILFYCKKFESLKNSLPSIIADEKSRLMQIVNSDNTFTVPDSIKRRERPTHSSEPPVKMRKLNSKITEANGELDSVIKKITMKRRSKDEISSIVTEIEVSDSGVVKNVTFPTLLDGKSDKSIDKGSSGQNNNLTLRMLKRASLILQAVNALKVIQDPQKLQRMINEEEDSEGFNYTIDRKTVLRLIEKLKADGHLKTIKVTLRGHGKEKVITFICHPSVVPEDHGIQAAIEQAKMKLPIITKEFLSKSLASSGSTADKPVLDHRIGRLQYGYKPKFVRLRTLHFYIFYLVYGYSGSTNLDQRRVRLDLVRQNNLDVSFAQEMKMVYHEKGDWKMFIPPLPQNQDYPHGWVLVSDLLLRLPLFVFVNLVNVTYNIPKLQEYLNHPIKKYMLVKDLPTDIYHLLTIMRKYIFTICDTINQLAYIGLIQFGPQVLKDKDQVFIYLNKNAKLLDTTSSDFGYNHISKKDYEQKLYHFESVECLENYWTDLWRYAMNTKLGVKNCVAGQTVVVESIYSKKPMVDALRQKSILEAAEMDVGYLPGDQLGAGGLDSDLFVHLKRNWYWSATGATSNQNSKSAEQSDSKVREISTTEKKVDGEKKSSKRKSRMPCKILRGESEVEENPHKKVTNAVGGLTSILDHSSIEGSKQKVRKTTKITRVIPEKKRSKRKPWYDQKDKEALKRMKKLRVDWTSKEDNVLLLCKVAQVFMSGNMKCNILKNYSIVREVLHAHLPNLSLNKTSRACQRRIVYILKNPQSLNSMDICLEELREDMDLVEEFGPEAVSKLEQQCKGQGMSQEVIIGNKLDLYVKFIHLLLKRMKSVNDVHTSKAFSHLPDTVEEFYNTYKVIVPIGFKQATRERFQEVQNTIDIMCSVVNCVIHSSLAGTTDKMSYSYHLLHIYQQYPDKLLRSVMDKCRSMGIVALKKKLKPCDIKPPDRCVPLNTSPYKISYSYVCFLQTKYQYPIFYSNFCGYSRIIEAASNGALAELNIRNGGECANFVELYCSDMLNLQLKFPDQVIVLDPQLAKTEEQYQKIVKRFKDLISHIKTNKIKTKNKKRDIETDYEDEETPKEDCDPMEYWNNSNGLASAASRIALFLLRDDLQNPVDAHLQHAHDYFVLNPSTIQMNFSEECERLNQLFADQSCKNCLLNRLKTFYIIPPRHNIDFKTPAKGKPLLEYIKGKKELGATAKDIRDCFGFKACSTIDKLIESNVIMKCGVVSVRFVHIEHIKPWVIRSYHITRLARDNLTPQSELPEENVTEVKTSRRGRKCSIPKRSIGKSKKGNQSSNLPEIEVKIRPWVRVDGTVNRRVLDRLLGSILGHILLHPGITVAKIQERFIPIIQQVHTSELIDMLHEIKCISLQVVELVKPTLFSSRSVAKLRDPCILDDPSVIAIIPEELAITRMGLFIGNKAYNEDFLQNIVSYNYE